MKLSSINISQICDEDYNNLSSYRKQKTDSLKQKNDKLCSVAAGVLINRALRDYDLEEKNIEYAFGEHGKPYFKDYPEIHFNISHSGDMCICVFSNHEIGCDIQKVQDFNEDLLKRFFAKAEQDYINSKKDKSRAFCKLWTMKESYIKATGRGLSAGLNSFCVFDIKDYSFIQYFDNDYSISICENIG